MKKPDETFERIKSRLLDFDVEALKMAIQDAVQRGVLPEKIIDVLSDGMDIVGEKFESGEFFVPDLIIAGETMKEAMEVLEPYLEGEVGGQSGTVVLATVAGDIHDIGKNIFATLMTMAGFNVIDIGVDVSAEEIVQAVRDHHPDILGLSALLTTNLEQFPIIIEKLENEKIRNKVKVIIGGAVVTAEYAEKAGVDGYAKTALVGVDLCKSWVKT